MIPRPEQLKFAEQGYNILARNMIVYLAMEERTGKTLTALLICERAAVQRILVITKKKALIGWQEHLDRFQHRKQYTVTNYHKAKKCNPTDYDLVILDESHNYISSFPKKSALWSDIKKLTAGKPIIYMSATPHAQGYQMLYHQFALSDWSPFSKWTNAYRWFATFGVPATQWLYQKEVPVYTDTNKDLIETYTKHLFITATRQELNFDHEPLDNIHYVELNESTKTVYNMLLKHKVIELNSHMLVCDVPARLRTSLHMLEGGVMIAKKVVGTKTILVNNRPKVVDKIKNIYVTLGNTEKIEYIKKHWGDSPDVVIMYNYIAERGKLEAAFKHATILQATSNAEGIDLAHKKHLIIYSQDFSTARHTQRRARQASKSRDKPIVVHYLLVKKAISEQVYQTVSVKKKNFVDSVFTREEL